MRSISTFTKVLDATSEWSGKIFAWSIVPLTLLVTYEVISRRVFNAPHIWSFEIIVMLYGFHFTMVAAYTLYHKRHVNIDVILNRFPPKAKTVIEILGYLLFFFIFTSAILIFGFHFAKIAWLTHEASETTFGPPLYPIKTVVPVVAFLLILQGISGFTKKLVFLIKGVEL